MHEPSPRTSRLVVAGAAVAVVLLGGGGFLVGRSTVSETRPAVIVPTPPPMPVTPKSEAAVGVLGRKDLIDIANAAADAASSGSAVPANVSAVDARRFEIYLPFGCNGPATEEGRAPLGWRYDADTSSLRVSVASVSWDPGEWLPRPSTSAAKDDVSPASEAIEGFWITRPWSSRETCDRDTAPTVPRGIEAVTLPGQTLGIAQIFSEQDSRNARRDGKPYESVIRRDAKDLAIDQGLRVRIRGRVTRFPGGTTVQCRQPAGREQRPVCLIAVAIDDVAIDNPATEETIAIWPTASRAKSQ